MVSSSEAPSIPLHIAVTALAVCKNRALVCRMPCPCFFHGDALIWHNDATATLHVVSGWIARAPFNSSRVSGYLSRSHGITAAICLSRR